MIDSPSTTRRRFLESLSHLAMTGIAMGAGLSSAPGYAAEASDQGSNPAVRPGLHPSSASQINKPIPMSLLEESPFVYISPILWNGEESSCHAELWYGWLDESIVVIVASDRWKATALARGLDSARIWVGDYGRWKGWFGNRNEAFRVAPNFIARVERVDDTKTSDRLLAVYENKYPKEIGSWRDSMRSGIADGSRVLLRYRMQS